jgi:murein DD-endopeptidase MepM/ murein hydrolase activator NlpD
MLIIRLPSCFGLTDGIPIRTMERMKPIRFLLFVMALFAAVTPTAAETDIPVTEEDISLPPLYIVTDATLNNGQTLSGLLLEAGLPNDQVHAALASLSRRYNLRNLPVGQRVAFLYKENEATQRPDSFEGMFFQTRDDKEIKVTRTESAYRTEVADRVLFGRKAVAIGTIRSSLFQSAAQAGLPEGLVIPYVELFAWDLDFTRDIRAGDRFEVLFEQMYDSEGNLVRNGDILAARFTSPRFTYEAFRAANGQYYDRNGESKERMLLRTPLKFSRISSHFNPNRRHPISGYTRAHRGTDFAAPTGTPIKAAGHGRIEQIGWNGGYGKYIRIRHNTVYQTAYAHLHNFARGMHQGKRVRQGEVIGYVGTTGASTGPHLHYELHRNGVAVDAMKVKLPNGDPLEAKYRPQLTELVAEADMLWKQQPVAAASNQ